jgi:glycopeptide antibiotics resistance protein
MQDRPVTFAADTARVRTVARWLTFCVIALILYGSLFPFRFDAPIARDPLTLFTSLHFARTSRGDVVANLLLYMPLGLVLMFAWPGSWSRFKGLCWAVLLGSLLSLGVELMQEFSTSRVSSLTDLALNAAGTAGGAVVAIIYLALGSTIRVPGTGVGRPDPVPLSLLALWLAFRLAPFVPTIDFQKYKDALKPLLLDPQISLPDVFRFVTGWLVAGYAVRRIWRREYSLQALGIIVALVLLGRIMIVGKALSPDEVLGLLLCIPCAGILVVLPDRRRVLVLALMLVTVIMLSGLKPFELLARPNRFSWVPFMSSLSDNLEVNSAVLLEKCFWYFALIWLLVRRGAGVAAATLMTAALLGAIEFAQVWIPGRSAEITDPLLALCGGILLALAPRQSPDLHVATGGRLHAQR